MKEQINIPEFCYSIERFIIPPQKIWRQNNFKKYSIQMVYPFTCFVFFLLAYLKEDVCVKKLKTLQQLQDKVYADIRGLTTGTLRKVMKIA